MIALSLNFPHLAHFSGHLEHVYWQILSLAMAVCRPANQLFGLGSLQSCFPNGICPATDVSIAFSKFTTMLLYITFYIFMSPISLSAFIIFLAATKFTSFG